MIKLEGFMDIITLHRQGLSQRKIAEKLGLHRNHVGVGFDHPGGDGAPARRLA